MRWFKKLQQLSIRSWNDLSSQFVSTFMGIRARSTPKESLVNIKQGRTEFLRSNMNHFNNKIVEVDKISDDAALMAVLSGLRTKTQFWLFVHEDGPATYQEFLSRAEKYISAEEATSDQENEKGDQMDNAKGKEKYFKPKKKEVLRKHRTSNTQTKGKDILKKPVPMRASSSELNQMKYCRYHRSAGHDTEDYQDLEVGGSQHLEERRRQRRKLTREAHTSYQVLSSAIAKPDMEKFSFSKEDASHVLQPHSNALVITMPVSRINIHRTVVDDRSSINVLYLRTFNQMEIDVRHVKPFPKPF
ncbi:Ribonuclease H [Abeliophyllum distichum]|uniref:Ribonuclease H n=1 Tax=Abeliophyllum distichum TaxID=126358 RepID=A0ABD1RV57_9LAMI